MGVEVFRGDGLGALPVAQAGDGVALVPAHGPQQAEDGIGALVVDLGGDGVAEVDLFALDKVAAEHAVLGHRLQQQLPQEAADRGKDVLPLQGIGVLDEVGIEAPGLHLALFTDERTDAGPVQLIQQHGDAHDIRVLLRAPQQDAGQQGIFCRLLPAEGTEEADAETAGFEFIRLHGPQKHAGQQLDSLIHSSVLSMK